MRPMALGSADIGVEGTCEERARLCLQKSVKGRCHSIYRWTKIIVHKELGWHTKITRMCQQTKVSSLGTNQQRSLHNEQCTHNGILAIQKPGFVSAEESTLGLSHTWYQLLVVRSQS